MSHCRRCRSLFTDVLYGELSPEMDQWFAEHLKTCSRCASSFKQVQTTINIMGQHVRPEPESEYWDQYWHRLIARMDQQPQTVSKFVSFRKKITTSFAFVPNWAYRIAFGLACVLIGIFLGRYYFVSPGTEQFVFEKGARKTLTAAKHPELIEQTNRYLERSKLLLLGIVNFDLEHEDIHGLNLPQQRKISQTLVHEAELLKKELSPNNDLYLHSLISELEVILLQIANLEQENDISGIEMIKMGIDRGGILLQINLEEMKFFKKKEKDSHGSM